MARKKLKCKTDRRMPETQAQREDLIRRALEKRRQLGIKASQVLQCGDLYQSQISHIEVNRGRPKISLRMMKRYLMAVKMACLGEESLGDLDWLKW